MKKFEVVGCLFFWRITDNGFLEAATGLGEVCVWWKITNKLVCFMAIDRLETRFLLLHGIVFWLCHGGCRASGKCIYDKKLFVVHPFFRCDFFFQELRCSLTLWGPLAFSFFGFLFRKTVRTPIGGPEVIFKNRLRDSTPGANPCSGGFILALCWLVWLLVLCCRCPIADLAKILSLLHPSQPSDVS